MPLPLESNSCVSRVATEKDGILPYEQGRGLRGDMRISQTVNAGSMLTEVDCTIATNRELRS